MQLASGPVNLYPEAFDERRSAGVASADDRTK